MAESNATQVILTDDGIKIIKAQSTADSAAGGVTNLNDPNLMSVIEKQTQAAQYAGLTSQYNVVLARAKEASVSTTALTTAYTNLNTFMTTILTDTTKASDVDRDTYKSLTDAYNTALSNVQTALKDAYNTDISNMQSSVAVASQAASSATIVASQATATGNNASQAAEQASMAADQAKSAGDNATSVANNASQAASGAVIAGSQAAVKADKAINAASQAQIAGDNATSIANNASQAASGAVIAGSQATVTANKASTAASQAQIAGDNATSIANNASQAADNAVLAGSTATVNANKAISVASQAQIAGDNALANANSAVAKAESTASAFGPVKQNADSALSAALNAQNDASYAVTQASSAASDSKDAKQIAGAVSESYKTLTDGSTMTIAELQNGLAAKLTKTDLNGYATQDWSQNQIKFTADGINGTIASIKGTVDSQTTDINDLKADSSSFKSQFTTVNDTLDKQTTDIGTLQTTSKELSSNFSSLSTDNNTNKNDISELKQTSTKLSSTMETVQTQVQNSAVGTNLLQGTRDFSGNAYQRNKVAVTTAQGQFQAITGTNPSANDYDIANFTNLPLEKDTNYTASFWVKTSENIDIKSFLFDSGSNGNYYDGATINQSTTDYTRVVVHFHNGNNNATPNFIPVRINKKDVTVWLYGLKLEKGNLATDWCPNPADNATVTAVSQLSQTVDGMKSDISKKIEQKDLNGYATQDWANNQISVTANGINGTISSIKGTVDDHTTSINDLKADSSGFKTQFQTVNDTLGKQNTDIGTLQATSKELSSNFSSLSSDNNTNKNDISQLQQTAKSFSSTLTTVQTQVQNSAVGTNMLTNTGDLSANWSLNGTVDASQKPAVLHYLTKTLTNGTNLLANQQLNDGLFQPSTTYTASFYAKGTGTFIFYCYPAVTNGGGDNHTNIKLTGDYKRYTITFTTATDISGGKNFLLRQDYSSSATDQNTVEAYVYGFKLEKGSVATDWCLNPEDQSTQSDITQSINNIHLGFKNPDGSTFQMNLSADGVALMDFSKIMLNGSTNITNGTIGTAQIADAAITNAKIGKLAVGTAQIANGAITNAQIGSEAVGTAQIGKAAVGSAQIADLAVGTAQIGDGAITNAKIGKLAVGTAQIANGAITNAQIGTAAVGTANIKDAAISSAKIADLAVGTAQIGDGAITNAKIGKLAVGTAQIANAAITDAQVGNVSANKLTAGTIDFNTITGKNINASNITIGKLDTDRLNVGQLSALSADLGNVTTGSLKGVNIVAKTFSTPNGSFTTNSNGAVVAKNMTLTGGTLTSPTINASTINGSTINGTTFNAGDIINNANNMSKLYPTTISSDGHIYTTRFNPVDAMQTDLSTGALTTKYRAINTTSSNNQYEAYDTTLQADQIALFAGHTNGKDMSFTQSVTGRNQDGYVLISPLNGMTLHGDNQQITFNGTSADATPKGVIITPYGNINPNGTQNIWYVGNNMNMKTASFGMGADQNVPISFYRQTLVDEIGALGNRLNMGRLFLHATDNDAQMYLLNDSKPAFVSPTIYNRTYSNGANMFVTSAGRVGRSTSASKYKLAIARSDDTTQADRLMTLKPASWNDKVATEKMAESLSNGEIPVEAEINLKRHYGLIAEDLRDAGLDEFLITGRDGQIEGIEYDRLWTVLIPKIKQLNNRINELERKTL